MSEPSALPQAGRPESAAHDPADAAHDPADAAHDPADAAAHDPAERDEALTTAPRHSQDADLFADLAGSAPPDDGRDGRDPRRRPRRRWPLVVGGAAAVVILGAAAVTGLVQFRRGVQGLTAVPDAGAPPVAGTVHVQVSDTAYTRDALATGARTLLSSPGPEASFGDAPSVGPLATQGGVQACVAALGDSDADLVSIDLATYESQPAAIVVVRHGDTTTARVVDRGCTTGDPKVIQDAVPVP